MIHETRAGRHRPQVRDDVRYRRVTSPITARRASPARATAIRIRHSSLQSMCTSMRRPRPVSRLALALLVPVLGAACRSAGRAAPAAHEDADRIRSDIAYLADDRLEGRGTGTAGNDSAA